MAEITVNVDARQAIDLLGAARGAIAARRVVHDAAANAVAVQVRSWFRSRNSQRSQHTSSQYWAQASEAVTATADAESGRVTIRHPGVAWHRYGGTISAKPGKALAIPLRDSVYGVWPSERFPNKGDAFIWRHKGKAFLAARDGKALRLLYLLLKSVSKIDDPTVLPTPEAQTATAAEAVRQIVRLALRRHAASQQVG